jgi:hypothetical protein
MLIGFSPPVFDTAMWHEAPSDFRSLDVNDGCAMSAMFIDRRTALQAPRICGVSAEARSYLPVSM